MSFHNSACDIHLDRESGATFLVAICNNEWGCGLTSKIRLDDYIGNTDGKNIFPSIDYSQAVTYLDTC